MEAVAHTGATGIDTGRCKRHFKAGSDTRYRAPIKRSGLRTPAIKRRPVTLCAPQLNTDWCMVCLRASASPV
jgi:hypothetical protein